MTSVILKMEDDLNFWQNQRQPQQFGKNEDNLNSLAKMRQPQFIGKMEDINFNVKGRQPQI